jgi:hypothetical protein
MADFAAEVEMAESIGEQKLVNEMLESRFDSVKARQWLLERRKPERYAPSVQRVEMSGPKGGPIEVSARDNLLRRIEGIVVQASSTGVEGVSRQPE